jgi:hypothetical protein
MIANTLASNPYVRALDGPRKETRIARKPLTGKALRLYFSSTLVPRMRWVLSVLRKLGIIRSISSKYEDSAGTFCCEE